MGTRLLVCPSVLRQAHAAFPDPLQCRCKRRPSSETHGTPGGPTSVREGPQISCGAKLGCIVTSSRDVTTVLRHRRTWARCGALSQAPELSAPTYRHKAASLPPTRLPGEDLNVDCRFKQYKASNLSTGARRYSYLHDYHYAAANRACSGQCRLHDNNRRQEDPRGMLEIMTPSSNDG
jgi:hypothetical protein